MRWFLINTRFVWKNYNQEIIYKYCTQTDPRWTKKLELEWEYRSHSLGLQLKSAFMNIYEETPTEPKFIQYDFFK